MKQILAFLLIASLRQRIYSFENALDAYAFAVMHEGNVEISNNQYIVTI